MLKVGGYKDKDILIWVDDGSKVEDTCYQEARGLSRLPFIDSHVALMADCHASGFGMPIGGVIATKDVIIPEAVSNDIGCGVAFKQTDIPVDVLNIETGSGTLGQMLVGSIMRDLPTGFQHQDPENNKGDKELENIIEEYLSETIPHIGGILKFKPEGMREIVEEAYEIVGTLGGGNHFLEFQKNENDKIGIMIHTGSRSVGAKIHKYFNTLAKELNEKWYVDVISDDIVMPFLPVDSKEGQQYLKWMRFALEIAEINRKKIMELAESKFKELLDKYTEYEDYEVTIDINVHHNYADIENVGGENYWIHRKGAVRAREKDIVPIPGAMGSYSYICKGKQNPLSYHSCSHGAGRLMTRTSALEKYSTQETMEDLKDKDVILGKKDKSKVADEYYKAYKDIEEVIDNQKDLIQPISKLETVLVIKG
jgi:tRNA-splicing ligase RtcB